MRQVTVKIIKHDTSDKKQLDMTEVTVKAIRHDTTNCESN